MTALHASAELIRRGSELRAQSERMRAAADEKLETSRRLIAAAAQANAALMRAYGREPAGRRDRAPAAELPAGRPE